MWTTARFELRLTDDEFLALSYRQFHLLHKRFLTLRYQDQWQRGAITAAIYSNGMRDYDPLPKPDDFVFTIVPGQKHTTVKTARTNAELRTIMRAIGNAKGH